MDKFGTGIGLPVSGTGNIVSFTALNAGTAPLVATIVVTPTLANAPASCVGPTKTFTITVNPTPLLNSSLTPADVAVTACSAIRLQAQQPGQHLTGPGQLLQG